jgi:NADPH-dependent glutamate synthase beta subunit-like oxidoreductase
VWRVYTKEENGEAAVVSLEVYDKGKTQVLIEDIYRRLGERLEVSATVSCPVEFSAAFVNMTATQSCGKCTPCRVGLRQLGRLLENVLDGRATRATLDVIEQLAEDIFYSADCAIGFEAAALTLKAFKGFRDDFIHHIERETCGAGHIPGVPCVAGCPAHVDIPAYLALVAVGRYTDAMRVIRKDNPLAIVCGLVCEHPCELYCRRGMVDDPINIRGIKRYAADHMEYDYAPARAASTSKRVAIIGGGPTGLTAAYYLALMGHAPVIYEQRVSLGGMLRYGIPAYRLPRVELDREIDWLLARGIEVRTNISVGHDLSVARLREEYDAILVATGAHLDKKLGIEGEDAEGVLSAVALLRDIGDGKMPDFSGKTVVVVGGGNVAMDVARTSLRLGAASVRIAYRRRAVDMTAQRDEIHAAISEGCELLDLNAPVRVEVVNGKAKGLVVQPQIIGEVVNGRALNKPASAREKCLECDIILVAVGQAPEVAHFETAGLPTKRGVLISEPDTSIAGIDGVFAGGECVTGPATVIRAISAGKVAASTIDAHLGFDHRIELDVEIPPALFTSRMYCARSNMTELELSVLEEDFAQVEEGLLPEEALQEASRCLRCDHFGLGVFRGGRSLSW